MQLENFLQQRWSYKPPRGAIGFRRAKAFIESIGPFKHKIIHVAGTSGKGSVAYFVTALLQSQGFKVGLHMSPHILDVRERLQINNELISHEKFIAYFKSFLPLLEAFERGAYGVCNYFEVLLALALYVFKREEVDYVVLETGVGGLYDGTNVFKEKAAVLTPIGLDHMHILGDTLALIAEQKAGIIQRHNLVFSAPQSQQVREIFDKRALAQETNITYTRAYNPVCSSRGTSFDYTFYAQRPQKINLGMIGLHQATNANLALATVEGISQRDGFSLKVPPMIDTLKKARLVGRIEVFKRANKTIILDVAHNPQKIRSLAQTLKMAFPERKFTFLLAFKAKKAPLEMMTQLQEVAKRFIITQFSPDSLPAHPKAFDPMAIPWGIPILNPYKALEKALEDDEVVVTGSCYLLQTLYDRVSNLCSDEH